MNDALMTAPDSTGNLGELVAQTVDDLTFWLPTVIDDPAVSVALERAIERHDLGRPPLQIACRVFEAITGNVAPVRLSSTVALIHVGAGLHDDVADGDITGGRFAQAEALLISGVCLATLAPQAVVTLVPAERVLAALTIVWRGMQIMASGQRRDVSLVHEGRPDPRYVESALEKTSGECGLYAALGALVAGASDTDIVRWERIGAEIGYALQLCSDCQDVIDVGGRDIPSGARTLPIALALQSGDEAARDQLRDTLRRAVSDPTAHAQARDAIAATRSLAACATLIEAAVARAERLVAPMALAQRAALAAFIAGFSWLRRS